MTSAARALRQLIRDGCYGEKGSLPSITELAEVTGTTKNEVRAALSKLAGQGLVAFHNGPGWCVRKSARESMGLPPEDAEMPPGLEWPGGSFQAGGAGSDVLPIRDEVTDQPGQGAQEADPA